MSLSIVSPVYNSRPKVVEMFDRMFLDGIDRYAPADAEIILVDDCSPLRRETEDCIKRLEGRRKVQLIRNPVNLGYAKSCNVGFRAASKKLTLLTNTDVRIQKGTLDAMISLIETSSNIGMVSPVTNNAEDFIAQQVDGFPGIESYTKTEFEKIERFAATVDRALSGTWEVPWLLDFFCLFRTELFAKVGLYDENFGLGYGEELDYCLRARTHGYRMLVARSVFVFHGGLGLKTSGSSNFSSQSMNTRRLKALYYKIRNAFYMERKYGRKVMQAGIDETRAMRNPEIPLF